VPSDCPLIDPAVIDRVIEKFLASDLDFLSNLHPPTYPDGQDVEVMPLRVLEKASREATRDFEREHTTPYIWERPEVFRLGNVEWETAQDLSMSHRLTIDYPEDYEVIKAIYDRLYRSEAVFGLQPIMELLAAEPRIGALNARYAGVNWYRHHLDDLKTVRPDQTKVI
jgi:spore coat polysaccharide biosynthesis protein SpsF